MRDAKVARGIDHTECVIICGGWSILFLCKLPLNEHMTWEKFHGSCVDDRPLPEPPNFERRRLRPLTRQELHTVKKLAFGVLQKKRAAASKKAAADERRKTEEPLLL